MAKSVGLSLSVSKLIIFIVVMVYITTYLAGLLRLKKENDTILNHHLPQVTNKVGLHSYSKKLTTNYFIKKLFIVQVSGRGIRKRKRNIDIILDQMVWRRPNGRRFHGRCQF